jgi:hypothetical protein
MLVDREIGRDPVLDRERRLVAFVITRLRSARARRVLGERRQEAWARCGPWHRLQSVRAAAPLADWRKRRVDLGA